MKTKLLKVLVSPLLIAGLLLAPLPGLNQSSIFAATSTVTQAKTKQISVYVDGSKLTLSSPAYKENGVTFVPMRDIFSALGASVVFEPNTQTIIGRKDSVSVSLAIGKKEAVVSGKTLNLDSPAVIKKGVTFVPVRFISQALEATVEWDDVENAVLITSVEERAAIEYEEWLEKRNNIKELSTADIVDYYDESIVTIYTNVGQGSGIVIGDQLILTNYHVMVDASSASASSIYGDEMKITGVVSYDEKSDMAIVKTAKDMDLLTVPLAYDFSSRKGDKVVAIGSPKGIENTVSDGLISNIVYEAGVKYIQTSAPIDHGSSGGALFNQYGELIGITSFGYTKSSADLNFAVSSNHAALLLERLTDDMIQKAKFLPYSLPATLVGSSTADIQKLLTSKYSSVQASERIAKLTNWEVSRDAAGWLVLSANIDPDFYVYFGAGAAEELRMWSLNLGYEFKRMLPGEKIQLLISFDNEYDFEPRGYQASEVTAQSNGKWRLKFSVIDMQLKDKVLIKVRL